MRFGACANLKGRMKGDDPEIDTAQTPKHLDVHLALVEKMQKDFQ